MTAVYFCSMKNWTNLKLCTTASHRLNGSFRYFCGMCTKLCQLNHNYRLGAIIFVYSQMIMKQIFVPYRILKQWLN